MRARPVRQPDHNSASRTAARAANFAHMAQRVLLTLLIATIGCNEQPPAPTTTTAESSAGTKQPNEPVATTEQSVPPATSPKQIDPSQETPPDTPPTEPDQGGNATTNAAAGGGTPTKFRLADTRAAVNELRLQEHGIRRLQSRRLVLLTDLPAAEVADLPALADELFVALEQHFGKLPPALDGSEFQVTGHLIVDEDRFRAAALMPSSGFTFDHGRHLNYEFWMYNPTESYYRRHLMLHEFIHCFMTCESGMTDIPPLWYIEGMAEHFATHRAATAGEPVSQFGVLPPSFEGFEGWGRISELRRNYGLLQQTTADTLNIPSFADVTPASVVSFNQGRQYAGSWGVCWLIHSHPQHQKTFAPLKDTNSARIPEHLQRGGQGCNKAARRGLVAGHGITSRRV